MKKPKIKTFTAEEIEIAFSVRLAIAGVDDAVPFVRDVIKQMERIQDSGKPPKSVKNEE